MNPPQYFHIARVTGAVYAALYQHPPTVWGDVSISAADRADKFYQSKCTGRFVRARPALRNTSAFLHSNTGSSCLPSSAAKQVGRSCEKSHTSEDGFFSGSS